jgi:hypothetical protein
VREPGTVQTGSGETSSTSLGPGRAEGDMVPGWQGHRNSLRHVPGTPALNTRACLNRPLAPRGPCLTPCPLGALGRARPAGFRDNPRITLHSVRSTATHAATFACSFCFPHLSFPSPLFRRVRAQHTIVSILGCSGVKEDFFIVVFNFFLSRLKLCQKKIK